MSSIFIVTIGRMVTESYAVTVPDGMNPHNIPHDVLVHLSNRDPIVNRSFGVFQNSAVPATLETVSAEIIAGDNATTYIGAEPSTVVIDLGSL